MFLACLIFYLEININRRICMGCSQSNLRNSSQEVVIIQANNNIKNTNYALATKFENIQPQEERLNESKQKENQQNRIEKNKQVKHGKTNQGQENVTKVKRAKELQVKPEHQKFISDIISKSKEKLAVIVPQTEASSHEISKSSVQVSAQSRVDNTPKETHKDSNHQGEKTNIQKITQNTRKIEITNPPDTANHAVKILKKQKQIQRKLNEFRNQTIEPKNKKAEQLQNYEYFDSSKTLYL